MPYIEAYFGTNTAETHNFYETFWKNSRAIDERMA
jgi:hypothetical protein